MKNSVFFIVLMILAPLSAISQTASTVIDLNGTWEFDQTTNAFPPDDVFLSFTGDMRINRLLVLPSVLNRKVTVKAQIRSLIPAQIFYGDPMEDSVSLEVVLKDKNSGTEIGSSLIKLNAKRDNITETVFDVSLKDFVKWTPERPFLYVAEAILKTGNSISDENTDMYIGNSLIPELKKIDPTRVWDAGYMREDLMKSDEMDEPHPYEGRIISTEKGIETTSYPLGNLDYKPQALKMIQSAGVPQLANEYGWIWLW